jgi:hypothetical protein
MIDETIRVLKKIIECGKAGQFSELDWLFPHSQSYQQFLQQLQDSIKTDHGGKFLHYYDLFGLLADSYDFEDLSNLIKGLTIVENNKQMGSVSPVIGLYAKLVEKEGLLYLRTGDRGGIHLLISHLSDKPNKAIKDITQWILKNSENIYLPFGISTVNSRTIPGIRTEIEIWMQRKQEVAAKEENKKKDNDEKNIQRRIEIDSYDKKHQGKNVKQREYREYLTSLDTSQLLQAIVSDNERSIYFYANELINAELRIITVEDKENVKSILKRFKPIENGKFKRILSKLTFIVE